MMPKRIDFDVTAIQEDETILFDDVLEQVNRRVKTRMKISQASVSYQLLIERDEPYVTK